MIYEKFQGWGLTACQVEEYPWGSGNSNRKPDNSKWDEQSVLRLIPTDENQSHGGTLGQFLSRAAGGRGKGRLKAGLHYKVEFSNGPSGTADEDYFLGEDRSKNRCALPYGNAFLLVNSAAVDAGERSYDPW